MYKNLFSCKNKIVLIIGGSGLIGRELVQALVAHEATVINADLSDVDFSEVLNLRLDIASQESIKDCISNIMNKHGKIDVLINCAYPRTKDWGAKLQDIPLASFYQNLNIHIGGYFEVCRQVSEIMLKEKSGSIINFSSIYGIVAPDFSIYGDTPMTLPAAYAPIKAGIISMSKYFATYYGKHNIRVNTVSPGGIFDNQPETFMENYEQKTPLCRMGKPEDIVGAAIFLASDASTYITGHNLIVDGGWTAW